MGATNIHTQTLTGGTININAIDNVVRLSVVCNGGTVTYLGNSYFQGTPSSPVTFTLGEGATVTGSITNPIDGVTIDATAGEAEIIISTQ